MLEPSALSALIGSIYDSALDRTQWPVAMAALQRELNCSNSALALMSMRDGSFIVNVWVNIPEPYASTLGSYGTEAIDLWGGPEVVATPDLNVPYVLSRLHGGPFDFSRTTNRYALDWARPQGLVDLLSCGLARDSFAVGSLSFGRHESQGIVGDREIAVAQLFLPHLQRAATITRLYDSAKAATTAFESVLETLAVPVFLVTRDLHVLHCNPSGRVLLDEGYVLTVKADALRARDQAITTALATAVTQAADDESALERRGFGVPVADSSGRSAAVYVMPLRRRRLGIGREAVAALFVAEADRPAVAPATLVAALFDLTPAEARVFGFVATGLGVPEVAKRIGAAIPTVKTHLQRIFDKTGTSRQAELALLARSLAAPVVEESRKA